MVMTTSAMTTSTIARALFFGGLVLGATAPVISSAIAAGETPTPKPAAEAAKDATKDAGKDETLVYIFSGAITGGETYSGTLIAAPDGPQFELKLAKGATCDGSKLEPDKGLLRLPETPCSDGRPLKALFVYQEGGYLRVYGTIGGERFASLAHSLPSDAPEAKAAPSKAPPADLMGQPK